MSLTDGGNGMVMPVGPMNGYGASNGMGWCDGSFWIIVLFLFALMGNGWGGGYGANAGGSLPLMMNNTQNDVQRGFDQQAVMNGIGGVQAGLTSLAQGQCAGFAGVNAGVANGFAQAEISANARQIANMQQNWNSQTAIDQRLDTLAMNQQQIGCENRAAVADLKYTMANESAATRTNTDAKVQLVMDKLCQLEMDGIKQNYENRIAGMQNQIDQLRDQVNTADRNATANAHTAAIQAGQRALANEIEQYVLPTPRPAYVVQNPNCCQKNFDCGCGIA